MTIRICIFTYEYPPHGGGAGLYVSEFAAALRKRSCAVDVFAAQKKVSTNDVPEDVRWVASLWPHVITFNLRLRELERTGILDGYDLYIHNEAAGLWLARRFFMEKQTSMILYHHSIDEQATSLSRQLKLYTWQFLQNAMMKRVGKLIFPDTSVAQRGPIKGAWQKPYVIVPFGIEAEAFREISTERVPSRDPDRAPQILFPGGGQGERKGFLDILPLLNRLYRRGVRFSLVVTGDGKGYLSKIRKEVLRRGLQDQVSFPGRVPYNEIPGLYSRSDIVILPSRVEGFGRPVLEALAAGKPCITFKTGVAPRVIRDGKDGYVAEDLNDFEQILTRLLLDDKERAKVASRASSSKVPAAFQWDHIAARFLDEYFGTPPRP